MRVAENKLLKAHGATWLAPIVALLPQAWFVDQYKFEWSRGFVERARITIACLPMLEALLEVAPLLRGLDLRAAPEPGASTSSRFVQPTIGDALADPLFARIGDLECDIAAAGNELAFAIARAASLANVHTLRVHASVWGEQLSYYDAEAGKLVLTDAGAVALAESPHLANVRHLRLDSNRIGLAGVKAIAHGAWRLETLDLGHNAIAEAGLVEALRGPATEHLTTLRLAGNPLDVDEVTRLAKAPWLARVVDLDLESCAIGAAGAAAFCTAFALPALRRLRLERNSLGEAGGVAIAQCAALAQLTDFEAGHNRMGQKAGRAFATSPHLANLERLLLNEPRWKPDLVALFAASPTLATTRIYLKGKLVVKTKAAAASGETPATAPPAAPKSRRSARARTKPTS
jgi:hypothetical protein